MRRDYATVRASRLMVTMWVVAAMLLLASTPVCAQRLYGCDNTGRLFIIDAIAGAGMYVCDLPIHPDPGATEIEFDDVTGLAFVQSRDGVFSGQLFDILSCSAMGSLMPTDDFVLNGLEYADGVLYGTAIPYSCEPSLLVTLDPTTGSTTVIGPTGMGPIAGLAWDPVSETMYGVTGCWQLFGFAQLVTIDLGAGLATAVGGTGVHLGSLEFGANGLLYAGGNNRDGGHLYVIDTATGAATLVGSTGFNDVTGLALVSRLPSMECPPDVNIPTNSTIPSLSLVGFRITNAGSIPSAFTYSVSAEGPATLVDQGDPASLSGTTPTLEPGASFDPPGAGLLIPAIRKFAEELVTYHVSVNDPGNGISCTTVITFDPPVPVFVAAFDATPFESGVGLTWEVVSDEEVMGFRIYRRLEGAAVREDITSDNLISLHSRTYTDEGARGGATYEYTLGVVLADRSEVRSQAVTVKTKFVALTLHQNTPNPFNPSTTISFTLPERMRATLSIYDVEGRRVRTLVDETVSEGYQEYIWDGNDASGTRVSTGVYFYSLRSGSRTLTKKMLVLK